MARKLPLRPSMAAITPGDPMLDDLGSGIPDQTEEDEPEEKAEDAPFTAVAPDVPPQPEEDEPCPFPESYVPRTMQEATLLEQWRGRQQARHARARHEAELAAGRQGVEHVTMQLEAARVKSLEERVAEAGARCRRIELELAAAEKDYNALCEELMSPSNLER